VRRGDFPELAQLWQEQIDPAEQAALDTLAGEIKRTARRRGALEVLFTVIGLGSLAWALTMLRPSTLPIQLGFALLALSMGGIFWKRRQIVKGANALVTGEPGSFFAAAIENARAELRLSAIVLALLPPGYAFLLVLLSAASGIAGLDRVAALLFVEQPMQGLIHIANCLLFEALTYRAYVKLRAQLRRLERMSREWEDE
jgi:hypothetical protein